MSTGLQYRPQTAAVTPPGTMESPVCLGLVPALYRVNAMSVVQERRGQLGNPGSDHSIGRVIGEVLKYIESKKPVITLHDAAHHLAIRRIRTPS